MIESVFNYIVGTALSFLAEGIVIFILVGLALVLLGLFLMCYAVFTRLSGDKIDGTIVGAVRDVKVSIKDGKLHKKRLSSGSLWPVYEYTLDDGVKRQQKGSTGGSHVYKYKTGQRITLIVYNEGDDVFVRDAGAYSVYVIATFFLLLGGGMIYLILSELSPQFNISSFVWLMAVCSLVLRYKEKLTIFVKDIRDYKENKGINKKASELRRSFDPDHLHPIEYFVKEREQRK